MKGDAFFAFYGDGMGLGSFFAKAGGIAVVVGGLYAAFGGDPDDIEKRAESAGKGAVATGSGLIQGLTGGLKGKLADNGYDLDTMSNDDIGTAIGSLINRGLVTAGEISESALEELGIDGILFDQNGNSYGIYVPEDGEPLFGQPPEHVPN